MSRVTVACTANSKDETLKALRKWGCLHILPLQTPENEAVSAAKTALSNAQKALDALPVKPVIVKAPQQTETLAAKPSQNILDEISAVLSEKKAAEGVLAANSAELSKVEAFGEFDPHKIRKLHKRGLSIKLYSAEEKSYKGVPDNFTVEEFKRAGGEVFFAVIGFVNPTFSPSNKEYPYKEIELPQESVAKLKEEKSSAIKTIAECERKLNILAFNRKEASDLMLEASDELAMQAAGAGMKIQKVGEGVGVAFIQGYCPIEKLNSLEEFAAANGWGITSEVPEADEAVPTLLKHSKAVRPIDALYNVIGITPGYREIDVSAVFLTFFSIFFAMIVGDAAYGLLFMGITFWASKKFKDAPRYPFQFLYLMSGCTIVWGFLNASFLGLNTSGDSMVVPAAIDIVRASWSPDWLKSLAAWIRDSDNTKFLCFILAIIHLTIAHVWNAWAHRDEKAAVISQVGWLCTTWLMFFLARNMVLGHSFPEPLINGTSIAIYLGIFGAALIVVGAIMKREWFNVGMLPLNLVSNLVDVISYIRLFAVGMAGFSVANAFNNMVAPMFGSIVGTLGAAMILILVHALNIALAAMGVAVHAVRLNTLEFSNGVGLEWSGNAYTPFKKD